MLPCFSVWVSAPKDRPGGGPTALDKGLAGSTCPFAVSHPSLLTCSPGVPHMHARPTSIHSFPGVAISTYAKYCYHKLQKAALTGAKKVPVSPGTARQGRVGCAVGSPPVRRPGTASGRGTPQLRSQFRPRSVCQGIRSPDLGRVEATPAVPSLPPSGWHG